MVHADISMFENLEKSVSVQNSTLFDNLTDAVTAANPVPGRGAELYRVSPRGRKGLSELLGNVDDEQPLIYEKHFLKPDQWQKKGGEHPAVQDAYRKIRGVGSTLRSLLTGLEKSASYYMDIINKESAYFQKRFSYQIEDIKDFVDFMKNPTVRRERDISVRDIADIKKEVLGVLDNIYDTMKMRFLSPVTEGREELAQSFGGIKKDPLWMSVLPKSMRKFLDRYFHISGLSPDLSATDREGAIRDWDTLQEGYTQEAHNLDWLNSAPPFEINAPRQERVAFWLSPMTKDLGGLFSQADRGYNVVDIFKKVDGRGKDTVQIAEQVLDDLVSKFKYQYGDKQQWPPYAIALVNRFTNDIAQKKDQKNNQKNKHKNGSYNNPQQQKFQRGNHQNGGN